MRIWRFSTYAALFLGGALVGVALVAGPLGVTGNEVLLGALVGAVGAIVGGWLGAYVLRKSDDERERRRSADDLLRTRQDVAAALQAMIAEAAGNQIDIKSFLERGLEATTEPQDTNYELYQELLARRLPTDVYFLMTAAYRGLAFVRRQFRSGKSLALLSVDDKKELEYARERWQQLNAVLQGVLKQDYGEVAQGLAGDPRETVKRYLPNQDESKK